MDVVLSELGREDLSWVMDLMMSRHLDRDKENNL